MTWGIVPSNLKTVLVAVALLAVAAAAPPAVAADNPYPCPASSSWVSDPSIPPEIPDDGSDFCDFYQYAWQTFLYLVSPSATEGERNFEVTADFPVLQSNGSRSCGDAGDAMQLFVRTLKAAENDGEFTTPESINQAGGGATIYDVNGNVVFYTVQFSRNLCTADHDGDLPAGTTELKLSWRQIADAEADDYFTIEAVIEGVSTPQDPTLLGLAGFHLFRTTPDHPEGVWMTWEHEANNPDCLEPQAPPAGGWAFTSPGCATCLANSSNGPLSCGSCDFNEASACKSSTNNCLKGAHTEICRVYRDGSGPKDAKVEENLTVVDELNAQLVGPDGILSGLAPTDPMAVFANYFMVGGLWVSDPSMGSTSANERGSLQLSNTTMETIHQGDFKASSGGGFTRTEAVNCFDCHGYVPGKTADCQQGISHIFDDVVPCSSETADTRRREPGGHSLTFIPAHRVERTDAAGAEE